MMALLAAGCSIEGARRAGDLCLNDRECASPLRCELGPTGSSRCVVPVRVDASLADAPSAVDAGEPADRAAGADEGAATPDVAVSPLDAGGMVEVASPSDRPTEDQIDAGD